MSSLLEFRHFAISLPSTQDPVTPVLALYGFPPLPDWNGDGRLRLVFVEAGDSNCFDLSGRVSRRWSLAYMGSAYQVLRDVIFEAADHVHGGITCFRSRRRWTRPENYIAHYRGVLDSALPVEDLRRQAIPGPALEFTLLAADLDAAKGHTHTQAARERCEVIQDGFSRFTSGPLARDEGIADLNWLATALRGRHGRGTPQRARVNDSSIESLFQRYEAATALRQAAAAD